MISVLIQYLPFESVKKPTWVPEKKPSAYFFTDMTILWIKCRVFQHYQVSLNSSSDSKSINRQKKLQRKSSGSVGAIPQSKGLNQGIKNYTLNHWFSLYDFAKLVKGQCSDEDCLGWKSINITWIGIDFNYSSLVLLFLIAEINIKRLNNNGEVLAV